MSKAFVLEQKTSTALRLCLVLALLYIYLFLTHVAYFLLSEPYWRAKLQRIHLLRPSQVFILVVIEMGFHYNCWRSTKLMKCSRVAWAPTKVAKKHGLSILARSKLQAVRLNGLWPLQQHSGNSIDFAGNSSHFYCIWPRGCALSPIILLANGFLCALKWLRDRIVTMKNFHDTFIHSPSHHYLLKNECENYLKRFL